MKRSRVQSGLVPMRRIWRVMVPPEYSFHSQTFRGIFAAEVVAGNALGVELALDDDLRRDAGVVGARLPQGVVALHPVSG